MVLCFDIVPYLVFFVVFGIFVLIGCTALFDLLSLWLTCDSVRRSTCDPGQRPGEVWPACKFETGCAQELTGIRNIVLKRKSNFLEECIFRTKKGTNRFFGFSLYVFSTLHKKKAQKRSKVIFFYYYVNGMIYYMGLFITVCTNYRKCG